MSTCLRPRQFHNDSKSNTPFYNCKEYKIDILLQINTCIFINNPSIQPSISYFNWVYLLYKIEYNKLYGIAEHAAKKDAHL